MAMLNHNKVQLMIASSLFILSFGAVAQQNSSIQKTVSLQAAIELASQNDPWHRESRLRQSAVEDRSIAVGELPDPSISVSMINLPIDSWKLNQEPMTQLKVGVSQMFPRGDTLELNRAKLQIEAGKFPLLRQNRVAQVSAKVAQHWLNAYQAQKTIELIENDRELFEQMVDVARASYSSALGKTRQHDVIRAQLELVQLEDRLTEQAKNYDVALASLNEWLYPYAATQSLENLSFDSINGYSVENTLPSLEVKQADLLASSRNDLNLLAQVLMQHPAVRAIDIKYQASQKNIEIANQGYKPKWGVNASYSYRDDAPNGSSRADFFSVGVSMDIPLFTEKRQDKQVSASVAEAEAVKTEKLLLAKSMLGQVQSLTKEINRLKERAALYQSQLLQQSQDQATAALNAYTNDDGDFAEVVRAKIAELNMRIAKLKIDVAIQKSTARLNYFLTQSEQQSNSNFFSNTGIGE